MDRMHLLVERKAKGEISRKDRDLRRMLGHFDMLERVNSRQYLDEVAQVINHARSNETTRLEETTSAHVENVAVGEHDNSSRCSEWSDLDKNMVLVDGNEVDEDDDSAISDDGSIPDEDELLEYGDVPDAHPILIQDEVRHSPPSYVEDALNELNKMSLQPSFEENTYEVSEDD